MSINRDRKEASRRLGVVLEQRYRRLVDAGNDPDAVTVAAVDLGQTFNDNIEFIIYVLKLHGGLTVQAPERASDKSVASPIVQRPAAANDLPAVPAIFTADVDMPKKLH